MKSPVHSETSNSTREYDLPYRHPHHHHVPKVFSLPDTTPENEEESQSEQEHPQRCGQQVSKPIIQLIRRGEGKDLLTLSNFMATDGEKPTEKKFSFHRPILVRDTPESIGMKIPKGRCKKRKRKMPESKTNANVNLDSEEANSVVFSIRDVADAVGHSSPVQVINVLSQEVEEDLDDWTFRDLVEYFEDEQRLARNQTIMRPTSTPLPTSPTGRSRRKAAIQAEKCFSVMIHNEESSGDASTRILNQISYEFSGTPLHSMVRSPKIVRDVDWIDHAWPAERKPRDKQQGTHQRNKENINTPNKASKGKNSFEYPVVQYYCLTSAAGSYTDFHIDFGGSSVWYHVVRGKKIFVVSPPTAQNLRVYEEWLCHPDQAKIFLPDLMSEKAGPDIHCYSASEPISSSSSVSTSSSSSACASNGALGDLADETAVFRNSLKCALSTSNSVRFTLNAGETLILPAGWIHCVYTPVDSLVFGGNFLHGLDIHMQLTVNGIEARTRVLDQYRFPHFGALQMYAGGLYLKRLRAMGRDEGIFKVTDGKCVMVPEIQAREREEKKESSQINAQAIQESSDRISSRELEELPMLMNALEYWWLSEEDSDREGAEIEYDETKIHTRDSRTYDSITSHASFRDAAVYVAKDNGCQSVEDFIATFRNEYARIANLQWGSCRIAPSDDPTGQLSSSSVLPVPLSSIPIAIGRKPKKKTGKANEKSSMHPNAPLDVVLSKEVDTFIANFGKSTGESKEKKEKKPSQKRNRKGTTELDDPLDVVLSRKVKEYLASVGIKTAAQLLLASTSDVAKNFAGWRKQRGMPELKGRAGAAASVSIWKRKVRLRATLVGATQLAQLNVGTNSKYHIDPSADDRKQPPSDQNTK